MSYFKYFPKTAYKFGEEPTDDAIQNISVYSNVVDQIINNVSVYDDVDIFPGERPDQLSLRIYNTDQYYWTFYLMNPNVRANGWPLSPAKLNEKAVTDYSTRVITTRTKLVDKFKVGQTITGTTSSATATIAKRNLDLGQLFLENVSGTFVAAETVNSTNGDGANEIITVTSFEFQYNAAHHYENASGETVDIDPEVGPGASLTEVTWTDRLQRINDENRAIKVIRPAVIDEIVRSFRDAVGT